MQDIPEKIDIHILSEITLITESSAVNLINYHEVLVYAVAAAAPSASFLERFDLESITCYRKNFNSSAYGCFYNPNIGLTSIWSTSTWTVLQIFPFVDVECLNDRFVA